MEFIDLQYSFYNLRAEHCERIKSIVKTHKAVAFFTDVMRTRDDVENLLAYLDGLAGNTVVFSGANPQTRRTAITEFNMQVARSTYNDDQPRPRLLTTLRNAVGFKLDRRAAIVTICRTAELGNYAAMIEQAKGRHGMSDLPASTYEIFYGENHA